MLSRVLLALAVAALSSVLAIAQDDPIKKKMLKVKTAYEAEVAKLRTEVVAWYKKREEAARNAGNKKLIDELKQQREAFEAKEEWPLDMPSDLRTRLTKAKTQLETAYTTAIKEYTKAKKDDEASEIEKDLLELKKESWSVLDLGKAEVMKEGYLHIPPNTKVTTRQLYKGGVDILVVARTESENIRLYAYDGMEVIFNWEFNPSQLRVHRPSGRPNGGTLQSGHKITPLKPNTFYTLRWLITPEGMAVSVDGKTIFTEKREYNLNVETKIGIGTMKSNVDVKEFKITPVK